MNERRVATARRWLQKLLAPQAGPAWRERQRAAWDAEWWRAVDVVESSHIEAVRLGADLTEVDLPSELVDRLDALLRDAGPEHAVELAEVGRDLALTLTVAKVGAFDLISLGLEYGRSDARRALISGAADASMAM